MNECELRDQQLKARLEAAAEIYVPIAIVGPPHSGKYYFAQYYFQKADHASHIPLYISPQTTSSYLYGSITCTETPGTFRFKRGVLSAALESGQAVLLQANKQDEKSCFSVILSLLLALSRGISELEADGRRFAISPRFRLVLVCDDDDQLLKTPFSAYFYYFYTVAFDTRKLELVLRANLLSDSQVQPLFLVKLGQYLEIPTRDLLKIARRLSRHRFSAHFEQNNEVRLLDYKTKLLISQEVFSCFVGQFETTRQAGLLRRISDFLQLQLNIVEEKIFSQQLALKVDAITNTVDIGRFVAYRFSAKACELGKQLNFAETHFTKRLLQEIVGCVANQENLLLISPTGVGKTFTLQVASALLGNELKVVNFSSQTDVSDLIGGYKPVAAHTLARRLYEAVFALAGQVLDVSEERNKAFLQRVFETYESANYALLGRLAVYFVRLTQYQRLQSLTQAQHQLISKICTAQRYLAKFGDCRFFFEYQCGVLVNAMRDGHFLLLDEVNLAPVEVLEYIQQVLQNDLLALGDIGAIDYSARFYYPAFDETEASVLVNSQVIRKHPSFRIFASMNPAAAQGAAGKRPLPEQFYKYFTCLQLREMDQKYDIAELVRAYVYNIVGDRASSIVECYMALKSVEKTRLSTSLGQAPVFTIRSLCRALRFVQLHYAAISAGRALFEGFSLYFASNLVLESRELVTSIICEKLAVQRPHLLYFRPTLANLQFLKQHALVNVIDQIYFPYGTETGASDDGKALAEQQSDFVLTEYNRAYLRQILHALLAHQSILLEGVTSAGKSSLVVFLAKLLKYEVIRINNHENTDISDYLGTFQPDQATGYLSFIYGPLVRAMRSGAWVILDELNLCNSEILEALNRLLDDNGEMHIAETNEIIKPAPGFAIFATQNPAGIVNGQIYGGRKQLSDAFKNRFVSFEIEEITEKELEYILYHRRYSANLPYRFIGFLVQICSQIKTRISHVIERNADLSAQTITLRDVFRVADRLPSTLDEFALEVFMVFGERQRSHALRQTVAEIIRSVTSTDFDISKASAFYSAFCEQFERVASRDSTLGQTFNQIVFTTNFQRVFTLTARAMLFRETPLLIGEPGTGKTQAAQLAAALLNTELTMVNLHKNTDVSDFIGQMRPVRGRAAFEAYVRKLAALEPTDGAGSSYPPYECGKRGPSLVSILQGYADFKRRQLFSWYDGALLSAFFSGGALLLDEINLAPDAILERLNSVFETRREITIPEKQTEQHACSAEAHPFFFALATMNPAGDHGKRELSPALRNRMTEVFIGGSYGIDEIGLILARRGGGAALAQQLIQRCKDVYSAVRAAEAEHACQSLNFTLRDVIAIFEHCQFVLQNTPYSERQFSEELDLCYLDGLQVRMCTEDSALVQRVEEHIRLLLFGPECAARGHEPFIVELSEQELSFESANRRCAIPLYHAGLDFPVARRHFSQYNFRAPTTAFNAFRLARALASPIQKAVLIESSPGTGKTSVVQQLARITNHAFVRINLSENVDLYDLIGQDLPNEAGGFGFVNGVLLQALETPGCWILLDELNLASYAVLEGLNSLFDHRRELFIPELSRVIKIGDGVRVFAAYNPAWYGNGRKQLPQSFLNRFLCLWFFELYEEDYRIIISDLFATNKEAQTALLELLMALQRGVNRDFGHDGGVWEINLRDILRVYDYVSDQRDSMQALKRACCYVFMTRFRKESDLRYVWRLINDVFDKNAAVYLIYPRIVQCEDQLRLGARTVGRSDYIIVQHLPFLEAMLLAFDSRTPVLLVFEEDYIAVDRLTQQLADLTGERLIPLSLSASTDVSDIFGSYEQFSVRESVYQLLEQGGVQFRFSDGEDEFAAYFDALIKNIAELQLGTEAKQQLLELYSNKQSNEQKFVWRDGVVIRAVEQGGILHLQNVNYCTAAVLDRLNSLLERDAQFYLYEQGCEVPRALKIHPSFRVVLSYQAGTRDISRAVRNRCFEVFVDSVHAFNLIAFNSSSVESFYDNLRMDMFSGGAAPYCDEALYNCARKKYALDSEVAEAANLLRCMTGNQLSESCSREYLALLRSPDTISHSQFFAYYASSLAHNNQDCARSLQYLVAWQISYEYQSSFPSVAFAFLGAFQFPLQQTAKQLEGQFIEAIVKNANGDAVFESAKRICSTFSLPMLLLLDIGPHLKRSGYLYLLLSICAEQAAYAPFEQLLTTLHLDTSISKSERYVVQGLLSDCGGEELERLRTFYQQNALNEVKVTEYRIQEVEQFLRSLSFDFNGGRAKYKNQSVLLHLCGKDGFKELRAGQSIVFNQMTRVLIENLAYTSYCNQSVFNLLNSPLLRILEHAQAYSYNTLNFYSNQAKITEQFNTVQHNTRVIVRGLKNELSAQDEFLRLLAAANCIPVRRAVDIVEVIRQNLLILQILHEKADFSRAFDEALLNQYKTEFFKQVVGAFAGAERLFAEHQKVVESRTSEQRFQTADWLAGLASHFTSNLEACEQQSQRCIFDEAFYEELQRRLEALNLRFLRTVAQFSHEQMCAVAEQFSLQLFSLYEFLGEHPVAVVASYASHLLPVLFILSSVKTQFDRYKFHAHAGAAPCRTLLVFALNAGSSFQAVQCLKMRYSERYLLLLRHMAATCVGLDAQEVIYLAAYFGDYDFAEFYRMLYEASPFRTKKYAAEATFEEGLQHYLQDLFPGYAMAENALVYSYKIQQIPDELDILIQYGRFLLSKTGGDYKLKVSADYTYLLTQATLQSGLETQDTLLLVLQSYQAQFAQNNESYGRQSTVIAQLKSNTQRRRVVCQNVYKTPYAAEVIAGLNAVKDQLAAALTALAKELPEDDRLKNIAELMQNMLTMDLRTPLIWFMRYFEILLDSVVQFNCNTPAKFADELIAKLKASIVYFRRIELASWNSFFEDAKAEQVNIALVNWADILVRAVSCCNDPSQYSVFLESAEQYLQLSTCGQLATKLDVLRMAEKTILSQSGGAAVSVALRVLVGRYSSFNGFVAQHLEQQTTQIYAEFAKQAKLFQWDEGDFRDFQTRIKKSHLVILGIVRKYSELLHQDVRALRDAYVNGFIAQKEVKLEDEGVASALALLQAIQQSKDKRNFMEMQLKAAVARLAEALQLDLKDCEIALSDAYLRLAEHSVVFEQLRLGKDLGNLSDSAIAALEVFAQLPAHKSLERPLYTLCRKVVYSATKALVRQQRKRIIDELGSRKTVFADKLASSELEMTWQRYISFLRTALQLFDKVLDKTPGFFDIQATLSHCGSRPTLALLEQLYSYFYALLVAYEDKYDALVFEFIRGSNTELAQQLRSTLETAEEEVELLVLPFAANYLEGSENSGIAAAFILVVQVLGYLLTKGFPEPPKEQDTRQQKQKLDGTGLGDEYGENDINSEVQEEQLSDDYLLGNDREEQGPQDLSDNDNGIDMDRDFGGYDYDVGNDETEEQEEEDLERELNSDAISNPDSERQRSMNENSEEVDEQSDRTPIDGEDQLAENQSNEAEEEERRGSDVSEQVYEYQQPDAAEEFSSRTDDSTANSFTQSQEESENASFSDVLDEIFQDEIQGPEEAESEEAPQEIMQEQNPLEFAEEPENEEPQDSEENAYETRQPQDNVDQNEPHDEEYQGFGAGKDEKSDRSNNDLGSDDEAERQGANGDSSQYSDEQEQTPKEKQDKQQSSPKRYKRLEEDAELPPEKANADEQNPNDAEDSVIRASLGGSSYDVLPDPEAEDRMEDGEVSNEASKDTHADGALPREQKDLQLKDYERYNEETMALRLDATPTIMAQARTLSERLLMLLAPTYTSQLCGDFRSGKRLNLRKIVPFVASNYRRDKIWLRREKPSKRFYNLVICVDDSRSVQAYGLGQELIDGVFVLVGAARGAELGEVTLISFSDQIATVLGPCDASSATNTRVGAALGRLTFSGEKSDFVGLFSYLVENQHMWGASAGKTLVLVLTDGMIGERDGLCGLIQRVQESAVVLLCVHNTYIFGKVQIVFENDASGARKPRRYSYLEKFPTKSYVVVREGHIAEDLGEAVAQYLAGMLE